MRGSIQEVDVAIDVGCRRGKAARAALVLAMVALLAFTLLTVAQDGDNSYMDDAEYVGSTRCYDCHDGTHDTWEETYHAGAFAPATGETVVADWEADTSFELAPGVTVTPVLIENASGLFMDLDGGGTHVYRVTHVQGAGNWLQVYVSEMGATRYILPLAWANTVQAWVPFHPEEWYDGEGSPRMAEEHHVWDLMCGACHTAGFAIAFNDTSGEWTGEWAEDGVTCESCHGPGSLHAKPPSGEQRVDHIWRTYDSALCGNCHVGMTPVGNVNGRPTGYPLNAQGETIRPGNDHSQFYDLVPDLHPDGGTVKGQAMQYNDYLTSRHEHSLTTLENAEGREDFCLMCHSTDYKLAGEGGEPDLTTAEHDIECTLCHDMHGTAEENNLRLSKWDTCVQCHRNGDRVPGEEPLPPHKEVVSGTIPIEGLSGDPWMDGKVQCTDCHMPPMGVREVPYDIPSHTWYFISPEKSNNLGMPNSCTVACHDGDGPGPEQTDEEALAYIETKSAAIGDLLEDADQALMYADDVIEEAEEHGFTAAEIEAANATCTEAAFALAFVRRDASLIHNPSFQMDVLNWTIEKGDEVTAALMPGTVQGFVKDAEGKAVAGAEVRMGDRAWVTTSGDGSFDFRIAPGDHTFDVYDGGKKEASFTATVTAGDTADAGTVKFEAEDEGGDLTLYMVIAIVVVIVVVAALLVARSRKGEG